MSDDQPEVTGRVHGERAVQLQAAARLENLAVLRMLVGAVATFEDLDVDTVADLRLAVDELCTQLVRCAAPEATLTVVVDPHDDDVSVQASAACTTSEALKPGSFSWHVLTSLADRVQTFVDGREPGGAEIFGITLTTRRPGARR